MSISSIVMGVDIGGTRTKYGLVNLATGERIAQHIGDTSYRNLDDFIAALERAQDALLAESGLNSKDLQGIGIGVPGFVQDDWISLVWDFLSFMEGTHFRPAIEEALKRPVRIENDARAVALGEYYYGRHGQPARMLSLTLGTGVGFGFVVDGALHERTSLAHMAGHILVRPGAAECYCGMNGCLESLVNSQHLLQTFAAAQAKRPDVPFPYSQDAEGILRAAAEGHPIAAEVASQMVADLVTGLNVYIYQYAPDMFVLGGGLAAGLHPFLPAITQGLKVQPFQGYHAQVRLTKLGPAAGLYGAASLWMGPLSGRVEGHL